MPSAGWAYTYNSRGLLVVAGLCWAALLIPVLRHWKTPTAGTSFLLSVATEGLAVLGATLAVSYRAGWLASAAAAALVLGLACYVFAAARFDLRELLTGHGDHWVAWQAHSAISALAAGHVTQAAAAGQFSGQHQALTTGCLARPDAVVPHVHRLPDPAVLRDRGHRAAARWPLVAGSWPAGAEGREAGA